MRKTMDNGKHTARIVLAILIVICILALFVYLRFVKGVHIHTAENNEWVVETVATCEEQGYRYKVCKTCGISFGGETLEALGHNFAEPVKENVVEADCILGGSYDLISYCSRCNDIGSKKTEYVDKLGHKLTTVKENVVLPTCTEPGSHEDVTYCERCRIETARVPVVDPENGHTAGTPVEEDRSAPTCTDKGSYYTVTYCTVCTDELSRVKSEIPENGHTPGEVCIENEVAPGCETTGSYDKATYCIVCTEECSRVTEIVAANGHSHTGTIVLNATTGSPELHTVCSECSEINVITSFKTSELQNVTTVAPTCTSTGLMKYVINKTFEGCNISAEYDGVVIPMISHTLMAVDTNGYSYNIIDTYRRLDSDGTIVRYGYQIDEETGTKYYDITSGVKTPGFSAVYDKSAGETYASVCDANGFALGMYYCDEGHWVYITVYNAKYDTRLQAE